jgi:hypothetical protein
LLKTNIEESLANDIDLMCQWSNNDRKYVINQLLCFAIMQAEDFQKYKAERAPTPAQPKATLGGTTPTLKSVSSSSERPSSTGKPLAGRE